MNLFTRKSRLPKGWIVGLGLLALVACSVLTPNPTPLPIPGVAILYAQSVPHTVTYYWAPDAATYNVTSYTVTCSTAAAPVVVPATSTLCTSTQCSTPVVLTQFGSQTCNVFATNTSLSGGSDVTGTPQNGPASPNTVFTLNQQAVAPTGNGVR